jgi:acetoin utilization protein AcuB
LLGSQKMPKEHIMLVRNRMSRKLVTVGPQQSLAEARVLLDKHGIRQLPVVRHDRLVGILTDRDIRSARTPKKAVEDVMTSKPVVVGPNVPVDEAARVLRTHKIGALPVVEGGHIVGILTGSDVLDAFVDLSGVAEPTFHLTVTAEGLDSERRIREIIAHERGELKWLHRDRRQRTGQVHLRVKARRIDDIVTELDAAGFEVQALIAPSKRRG